MKTASKHGDVGIGVGVGVAAAVGGIVSVGVTVGFGIGVSVGLGVGGLIAKHAAHSGFGSHGSSLSVPASISSMSLYPSPSESRGTPLPPPGLLTDSVVPFAGGVVSASKNVTVVLFSKIKLS